MLAKDALFDFACDQDVTKMPQRGRGHHCAQCEKTVIDTSRLTPEQAVELARGARPGICVSYGFDQQKRLLFRGPAGAGVAVTLAAFLAACTPSSSSQDDSPADAISLDGTPVPDVEANLREAHVLAGEPPLQPAEKEKAPCDPPPTEKPQLKRDEQGKVHLPVVAPSTKRAPEHPQPLPLAGAPRVHAPSQEE